MVNQWLRVLISTYYCRIPFSPYDQSPRHAKHTFYIALNPTAYATYRLFVTFHGLRNPQSWSILVRGAKFVWKYILCTYIRHNCRAFGTSRCLRGLLIKSADPANIFRAICGLGKGMWVLSGCAGCVMTVRPSRF